MWLLPAFSKISSTAAHLFYRLQIEGQAPEGPVLLVANHPNSLLDPALVAAGARRPVRFLAKAPLFEDPRVGWLIQAVGSIPVVRRMDDPSATPASNESMFEAAHEALARGAAIALFPEGTSHSDPQLKPLKTGAARIALGAAARAKDLQIVPVGLVFRGEQKATFRSPALVVFDDPVDWHDLRERGTDPAAVRELTERIDHALREVTVNTTNWEDLPLLETAEAIWNAEQGRAPVRNGEAEIPADSVDGEGEGDEKQVTARDASRRLARLRIATRLLDLERHRDRRVGTEANHQEQSSSSDSRSGSTLIRDIDRHRRRLDRLGLDPYAVAAPLGWQKTLGWTMRRVHLLGIPALLLAALGYLFYFPPFRLTGWWVDRLDLPRDQVSTNKLMFGAIFYGVWLLAATTLLGVVGARHHVMTGIAAATLGFALLVLCGWLGLVVRERWRDSARDVRRFLLLVTKRSLIADLRSQQERLAERIDRRVRNDSPSR